MTKKIKLYGTLRKLCGVKEFKAEDLQIFFQKSGMKATNKHTMLFARPALPITQQINYE